MAGLEAGDVDRRNERDTRRSFLAAIGVTSAVALAGCPSEDGAGDATPTTTADGSVRRAALPASALRELELAETARRELTFTLPSSEGEG